MIKDEKKIGKFKEWLPYFRWFLGFHIRFRLLMMFGILLGLNFVIAFLFIYYLFDYWYFVFAGIMMFIFGGAFIFYVVYNWWLLKKRE
jgi:hypothetical protein